MTNLDYQTKIEIFARGHLAVEFLKKAKWAGKKFINSSSLMMANHKKKVGLMKRYYNLLHTVGRGVLEWQISQVLMEHENSAQHILDLCKKSCAGKSIILQNKRCNMPIMTVH